MKITVAMETPKDKKVGDKFSKNGFILTAFEDGFSYLEIYPRQKEYVKRIMNALPKEYKKKPKPKPKKEVIKEVNKND